VIGNGETPGGVVGGGFKGNGPLDMCGLVVGHLVNVEFSKVQSIKKGVDVQKCYSAVLDRFAWCSWSAVTSQ
jgi:hypothetical protein